ncbi:hypothetical protein ACIQMV_08775 [Streptomyces sp. NPDC091412]|uniref:DUF7736 domain-containing protein n=1 Tax=Streptomyces sp. NPDC091412 TaxID=3366002 RepID=UPI003815FA37
MATTNSARTFPLADILTMTTGRLLSARHMDGVYDIANWMTGESLMTHQLPRAADACGPALLAQHPQLKGVEPPAGVDAPDLMAWLANTEREYGHELSVAPLAAEQWRHQDPIEELCDMVGPERVVVAPLPAREE